MAPLKRRRSESGYTSLPSSQRRRHSWSQFGQDVAYTVAGGLIGNVPGAIYGGYQSHRHHVLAAQSPRSPAVTHISDSQLSHISSSQKVHKNKMYGQTVSADSGKSSIRAVAVRRGPGIKRFRKMPSIKPDRNFKALVRKSLRPEMAVGRKTDYEYFYMGGINNNTQSIGIIDTQNAFKSEPTVVSAYQYVDYWMFHPYYFLDAASVLFNNKAATQGGFNAASAGYAPTTANTLGRGLEPGLGGTPALTSQQAAFTVVNSAETWIIKNNTQRTFTLKIILCSPKKTGTSTTDPFDLNTGGFPLDNVQDALFGPSTQWGIQNQNDRINLLTQDLPTRLKTLPMACAGWNQLFKGEITEVVLEPGTVYNYHVEGPKMLEVDIKKYFQGPKLQDIRKYCRSPIFIWHTDMVGIKTEVQGLRYGYTPLDDTGKGQGIYLERKKYCKIQCPTNMVGPIVQNFSSTQPQQIALNRPRYFTYNWLTGLDPDENMVSVQKENPQAPSNPTD